MSISSAAAESVAKKVVRQDATKAVQAAAHEAQRAVAEKSAKAVAEKSAKAVAGTSAKAAAEKSAKAVVEKSAKTAAEKSAKVVAKDSLTLTSKAAQKATASGRAAAGTLKAVAPKGAVPLPKASGAIVDVSFNHTYAATIAVNEPLAHADPHNTDKQLLKLIRGSKKTLDGAFYDIEDLNVTNQLIAAKKRGVAVRLVTDTDNLVEKLDATKPREAIARLKAAGVPVVDDQRSAIMHHKFMVVDGQKVWAGSTNLTPTSLYRHNNNALTVQSKELGTQFETEFNRLFEQRQFGSSVRTDVVAPGPVRLKNGEVQAFFSPNGGGRDAVVKELQGAKKNISFMTFSLTDPEISQTMLTKAKQGVKVEGVFDRWLAAGKYSDFEPFKQAGLDVFKDGNEALMHHKVMIVDKKTVITGSFNFSKNAERNNNEAFFIIRNSPSTAKSYQAEFERISKAARFNRPPAFVKKPDAEIGAMIKTLTQP